MTDMRTPEDERDEAYLALERAQAEIDRLTRVNVYQAREWAKVHSLAVEILGAETVAEAIKDGADFRWSAGIDTTGARPGQSDPSPPSEQRSHPDMSVSIVTKHETRVKIDLDLPEVAYKRWANARPFRPEGLTATFRWNGHKPRPEIPEFVGIFGRYILKSGALSDGTGSDTVYYIERLLSASEPAHPWLVDAIRQAMDALTEAEGGPR